MADVEALEQRGESRALATLVTAFASDPITRWTMTRPDEYLALFPLVLRAMAGAAFQAGWALATPCRRGVALWVPPGDQPDMAALAAGMSAAEGIHHQAPLLFEAMAEHRPEEPHWYLPFVGVDPGAQGRGLGRRLLAESVRRLDAAGLPAYLESTNPRNLPLYERFGFRVTAEICVADSPPMHPMWREPLP